MDLEVVITETDRYLFFQVTGKYSREDFLEVISRIPIECTKSNKDRVLVDISAIRTEDSHMSGVDRFMIGTNVSNALGGAIKLAVVGSREYYDGTAENVAFNRGARLRVFFTLAEAREWLLL